jgi:hypothetical protein
MRAYLRHDAPLRIILTCVGATLSLVNIASADEVIAPSFTITIDPGRTVHAEPNQVTRRAPEREVPVRPTIGPDEYAAAKARANREYVAGAKGSLFLKEAPLTAPSIKLWNFDGHSSSESRPVPDTHGALGTNHFIEVTNRHIDMYQRHHVWPPLEPTLVKSLTFEDFFGYSTEGLFDPRVVYDSTWQRWIVTADAYAESNTVQYLFIAVSKGDDPTVDEGFYIYKLNVDFFGNNDFYDFPQLGIDQDAVLFTANIFTSAGTYAGADFFAIAKARLYNNNFPATVPVFTGLVGTLAPPIVLDDNASTFLIAAPAYSTPGYTLTKYTATNTSHPGSIALVSSTITLTHGYKVPADAHQPGTTDLLDTLDGRFQNASTQNGDDLWQVHTVGVSHFFNPEFYRFNTVTNTVTQSDQWAVSGTSDEFNPSIAANANGDCFITYTATDADAGVNAQVYLTGKLNADTEVSAGTAAYTSPVYFNYYAGSSERWGDYSAVSVDPTDSSTAWLVNEKVDSATVWGSRIVRFGF